MTARPRRGSASGRSWSSCTRRNAWSGKRSAAVLYAEHREELDAREQQLAGLQEQHRAELEALGTERDAILQQHREELEARETLYREQLSSLEEKLLLERKGRDIALQELRAELRAELEGTLAGREAEYRREAEAMRGQLEEQQAMAAAELEVAGCRACGAGGATRRRRPAGIRSRGAVAGRAAASRRRWRR